MIETEGFGYIPSFGKHHFFVEIPRSTIEPIRIYEDMGLISDGKEEAAIVCRLELERQRWTKIRDDARRDFNARLKVKKRAAGSWQVGTMRLDRFLGRELCVLGWAAELASFDDCMVIAQKWLALQPEERWWLYSKTVAEAGLADDTDRGWRRALYYALSDGKDVKLPPKKPKRIRNRKTTQESEQQALFLPLDETGEI